MIKKQIKNLRKIENVTSMKPDIAIVICTYKPEKRIFERLLFSLEKLIIPSNTNIEICLVDNNNDPVLHEIEYIHDSINRLSNVKIIQETKPGLTFARLAGIENTTAPIVVFFDDDNEPDPKYLVEINRLFKDHPDVAVWGPGTIIVDFIDIVPSWVNKYRGLFQEKKRQYIEYGCVIGWQAYYPPGTGQVVKREILEEYKKYVCSGFLKTTDRKGDSLSSGGDSQIVYTAIKKGYAAGISPALKVVHLIPERRTNRLYLMRLLYGVASTGTTAFIEVFPTEIVRYNNVPTSAYRLVKRTLKFLWYAIKNRDFNRFCLNIAQLCGDAVGVTIARGKEVPAWLKSTVRILGLN